MGHASPSVVIWDVGGTLVYRPPMQLVLDQALRRAGLRLDLLRPDALLRASQEYVRARLHWLTLEEEREGVRSLAAMLLEGAAAASPAGAALAEALADYYDVYHEVPGIRDLLEALSARGVRQVVVSNWPPSLRGFLLHHDLTRYFALIVGSSEEGIAKPDPELFRRALERLGVSAGQAVYVGDDPEVDGPPTRQLGLRFIHFDWRGQHRVAEARDLSELRRILLDFLGAAS